MQDIAPEFATWNDPDSSFQIVYSLPLFHEIDFTVSEGYRRISHGGIETGGLLLGHRSAEGVRIEAFRSIECEHALGPSFKLSEGDIAKLRQQIEALKADPELEGLETLGWFISHTRGPLQLTPAELIHFNDVFPGSGRVTVLVKPEKFKPTYFAFLARHPDGHVPQDGTDRAIILPLPGRAGKAGAVTEPPITTPIITAPADPAPVQPIREPEFRQPTVAAIPDATLSLERQTFERQTLTEPASAILPALPQTKPPFQWQFDKNPTEKPLFSGIYQPDSRRLSRGPNPNSGQSGKVVAVLIILAAVLGGALGYWTYLQLPASVIPLGVQPQASGLLISWPPDQTTRAPEATVTVNDGEAVELPLAARIEGHWLLRVNPSNVKIELVVKHWLQDSRGIVRYIEPDLSPAPLRTPAKPATSRPADTAAALPTQTGEPDLSLR